MRKIYFLFSGLFFFLFVNAQVEQLYDFNGLELGNLDGQDGWKTIKQVNGNDDFQVNLAGDGIVSPDGTNAVFYWFGGPGVGRTATRKSQPDFTIDFQEGGVYELEWQMHTNWWGVFLGLGYDADADGLIAPGLATEPDDGGIFVNAGNVDPTTRTYLVLPNGTTIPFAIENPSWTAYKLVMDVDANGGSGAVALFYKIGAIGDWLAVPEIQGVNMQLTPGSGDKNDCAVWDGIFFHSQGGTGVFDNFVLRHSEQTGQSQFINFPFIPNKLTTDSSFELNATASSGLEVSYEVTSGPATISGNMLTLEGTAGMVSIKAIQPGDDIWAPAPEVVNTFEVVDPFAYWPEVTIRRPADATTVYMHELKEIMTVITTTVDHPEVLNITSVDFNVDGQQLTNVADWQTGNYTASWTPPDFGTYTLNVSVEITGGNLTVQSATFIVTDNVTTVTHPAFDGVWISPEENLAEGSFVFPTYVGTFNPITLHLTVTCPEAGCEPWDRIGYVEAKDPTGKWVEILRYITPYGVPCEHQLDITDYASIFQGIVDMRFYIETYQNGLITDVDLTFAEGQPSYDYSWVDVIWRGSYPFGDYADLQPVEPVTWNFQQGTAGARLKMISTGHNWGDLNTGNAAEFYNATHHILVNAISIFEQNLWVDCNPNPDGCQPQNGTWYYNRAGWCPGSISYVYDYDFTPFVNMSDVIIGYEFDPDYVDLCHPNHPDCITGVTCSNCSDTYNPYLLISGNLISYSNSLFVGVNGEQTMSEIMLYPNPATNQTLLSMSGSKKNESFVVEIFTIDGDLLEHFDWQGEDRMLTLTAYSQGIYILQVRNDQDIKVKKLVVH
ncbi:MAG: peptide-N-glycosidase F-related protein [Bacteroidales bacterium]|nr:peptide-N-glycosidase F-related protein [Bacteroidales bacterium]